MEKLECNCVDSPKLQPFQHLRSLLLSGFGILRMLLVAEGLGKVANQLEEFLEADLSVVVFIQPLLHLLYGGTVVCVLW